MSFERSPVSKQIIRHCPVGGDALDLGSNREPVESWLSLRGIKSVGFASVHDIEQLCHISNLKGGNAVFECGDPLGPLNDLRRFNVIHHQNHLSRYAVPWIHAGLARQVTHADWVVFSVPSVYFQGEPERDDERLLSLEEWKRILEPFEIEELKYYGEQGEGEKERILCVLRGEPETSRLRKVMVVPDEPFPQGISAIVHTRNESGRIADCLETLKGWTDEIIVCDMEGSDNTIGIATVSGADAKQAPIRGSLYFLNRL